MTKPDTPLPADADNEVTTHDTAAIESSSDAKRPLWRRLLRLAIMLSVPVALAYFGWTYWQERQGVITTDNAYVQQDKVSISAEIGGPIVEVYVKEGQWVEAGTPLFKIDPEPYELAVRQAEVEIASSKVSLQSLNTEYAATGVDIARAQESISYAQANFDRQAALWEKRFTTKTAYDSAYYALQTAKEELRAAEAEVAKAAVKVAPVANIAGNNPAIAAATVRRDSAALNLRRTIVRAPVAGRVAQVDRLQLGQMMAAGLPALSIVVNDKSWIEANFKETDLAQMTPGQPVTVTFDAFPSMKLAGHVGSIGAGTGSEFSVLPAQNATGNWVKVTQRVPVRIELDEKPKTPLIAGLSAEVEVDLGKKDPPPPAEKPAGT